MAHKAARADPELRGSTNSPWTALFRLTTPASGRQCGKLSIVFCIDVDTILSLMNLGEHDFHQNTAYGMKAS